MENLCNPSLPDLILFSAAAQCTCTSERFAGKYSIWAYLLNFHLGNFSHIELAHSLAVGYHHPVLKTLHIGNILAYMYGKRVPVIYGAEPFTSIAAVNNTGLHNTAPLGITAPFFKLYAQAFVKSADNAGGHKTGGESRNYKFLLIKAGIEIII